MSDILANRMPEHMREDITHRMPERLAERMRGGMSGHAK